MIASLIQDVRYALRQLRKTPGFTITAVLTLALGIGANAAIFTLVNAVLLKNLPVADPKTLVRLGSNNECCLWIGKRGDGNYALFPTATYQQLKKNASEFQDLAAMAAWLSPLTVRKDGRQEDARSDMGEFVSGNYFRTFGIHPPLGRLLTDADDIAGAPTVAILSYLAWQRDYAGDPSVVGSTFWVDTKPVTVVGVAPKGFYGDRLSSAPPDFYLPIESMSQLASASFVHNPDQRWLYIVGRLQPGVAMAPLQQKVSALVRQSFASSKDFSSEQGKLLLAKTHVVLTPGGSGIQIMQKEYASNLKLLMTISGLVLLIACANIANLLLIRGMKRRTEISVRTALGAQRERIVRQLLTESILLAGLSGMAGLVVAYAGTHLLLAMAFPGAQSIPIDASPSGVVLLFACGLSLLTGIVFGVAPAWITSNTNPADALRSGARTTTAGAGLLQRGLVIFQTALSLVLLVGAGLFSRSLNKLQHIDLKLDSRNRYVVHLNVQGSGYATTQLEALYRTIEDRFHALPQVKKVGISSSTPVECGCWSDSIHVQGRPDIPYDDADMNKANPEYFDSVGTRLLMGRGIGPQDTSSAPAVSVVNQAFVKNFFKPGESPIGHRFGTAGLDSAGDFEIVGVVENTTYTDVRRKDSSMYFVPMTQIGAHDKGPVKETYLYAGAIVLETSQPVNNMELLTRKTLAAINPNLTVIKFQTLDQQIADLFTEDRMIARLMLLFGTLALLLATVGLYGVTSYTVARRTSEIGIRMALGANRAGVVGMVMRGAILQTATGLAIGIPTALLCVRFIKSQLYNVTSFDLSVMSGAIVILALSAGIAALIPARRAASTDPMQALRAE